MGFAAVKRQGGRVTDFEAPLLEALRVRGEERVREDDKFDGSIGEPTAHPTRKTEQPTPSSLSRKKTRTTSSSAPIVSTNPTTLLSSQKS